MMPPDGHLLAEEPGSGAAPPDDADLQLHEDKSQVWTTKATKDGDCAGDKVATVYWSGP